MKAIVFSLTLSTLLVLLVISGCSGVDSDVMSEEVQTTMDGSNTTTESIGVNAAPMAPTNWHSLSDAQRNQRILDEARKWVGKWGGQCKTWLQLYVVKDASNGVVILPTNFEQSGHPYNLAQWNSSSDVQIVWQGAYFCPASFPGSLKQGHIIQMRLKSGGPHTTLIESVNSTQMTWLDSNWSLNEVVQRHQFTLADWSKKVEAWTVYQVK